MSDVIQEFVNSGFGQTSIAADSTCGLIISGVAVSGGLQLTTPYLLTSLDDAIALGITSAYDTANSVRVYEHVKDFYSNAARGTLLYIYVVSQATTLTQMADRTNAHARNLMLYAEGAIRLLGFARCPAAGYTPTMSNGMDGDSYTALQKAQELAEEWEPMNWRIRCLVEIRSLTSVLATAANLRALGYNRVMAVASNSGGTDWAHVGYTLGRAASLPVQRNLGYRKAGSLPGITSATINGSKAYQDPAVSGLWRGKGYTFVRPVQGLAGLYFDQDNLLSETDDDNTLSTGRVLDKLQLINQAVFNREVNGEVLVDDAGALDKVQVLGLTTALQGELRKQMVVTREVSSATVFIDPNQNTVQDNELEVEVSFRPVAQMKTIRIRTRLNLTQA